MKISKRVALSILCVGLGYPLFAQTSGKLNFTCTTAAPSGDWGNKHVAAIWIQNGDNPSDFIKTSAKYGHQDDHLTAWASISGKNMVDAFSGATLSSYGSLSVEWDGTDVSHNTVPDGDYSVYIEMGWGKNKTNDHAVTKYTFTKGTAPQQLSPSGNSNYSSVSLDWQPVATSISTTEENRAIGVFPNPSKGVFNLNFQNELVNARLIISDLYGKIVYSEKLQQVKQGTRTLDLSGMPAGMYLLTVYSEERTFTYKLMIEE